MLNILDNSHLWDVCHTLERAFQKKNIVYPNPRAHKKKQLEKDVAQCNIILRLRVNLKCRGAGVATTRWSTVVRFIKGPRPECAAMLRATVWRKNESLAARCYKRRPTAELHASTPAFKMEWLRAQGSWVHFLRSTVVLGGLKVECGHESLKRCFLQSQNEKQQTGKEPSVEFVQTREVISLPVT